MSWVRLPIWRPRPPSPAVAPPAAAPEPNPWDPVSKPTAGTYVPDGNAIYHRSSGFELLKSLPIISATIEFLDCGPLPVCVPGPVSPPSPLPYPPPPAPQTIPFTPINPRPPALVVTGPSSPSATSSGCSSCRSTPSRSSTALKAEDDNNEEEEEDEDPSPSYAEPEDQATSRKRKRSAHGRKGRPHRNHVVLRFQTKEAVQVFIPGRQPIAACNGVICSVEESTSNDDRCFFAMKPIAYEGVTKSASAAFGFDVLDGGGTDLTLRDVLRVCEEGRLLPFKYAVDGFSKDGRPTEVGCRDWMTQLFCRLHQAGYLSWNATSIYPESLTTKGFPTGTTTFAQIIKHRYSGIRRPGKRVCARLPHVEPSPLVPGYFGQEKEAEVVGNDASSVNDTDKSEKKTKGKSKSNKRKREEPNPELTNSEVTSTANKKIRWLAYNGEELGYKIQTHIQPVDQQTVEGPESTPEKPIPPRRSSRLAKLAVGT